MKKIISIFLVCFAIQLSAQDKTSKIQTTEDINKIKKVLTQFFEVIESQDTALYKEIVLLDGQICAIDNTKKQQNISFRTFYDDIYLFNPDEILQETPLDINIEIFNQIASAIVPYNFSINGKFSHCGIDIFILTKTKNIWKITNLNYTREKDCN